jgi:hypothetical protein
VNQSSSAANNPLNSSPLPQPERAAWSQDDGKPQTKKDKMKIRKTLTINGTKITAREVRSLERVQLNGCDYAVTVPNCGDVGFRCYDDRGMLALPDSNDVTEIDLIVICGGVRRRDNQQIGDMLGKLSA